MIAALRFNNTVPGAELAALLQWHFDPHQARTSGILSASNDGVMLQARLFDVGTYSFRMMESGIHLQGILMAPVNSQDGALTPHSSHMTLLAVSDSCMPAVCVAASSHRTCNPCGTPEYALSCSHPRL